MGCIFHQLDTEMKHIMDEAAAETDGKIGKNFQYDIVVVKGILRTVKKNYPNNKLTPVFNLVQEVQTRFGLTFDTVKRFLKASPLFRPLMHTLYKLKPVIEYDCVTGNDN